MEAVSIAFVVSESMLACVCAWVVSRRPLKFISRHREPRLRNAHLSSSVQSKRRLMQCFLVEMPTLLDVVSLGLSAGLSFDAALELYCTHANNAMSHELSGALFSWRCGMKSRAEALDDLAEKVALPAFRRFVSAVTESLSFGLPLSALLTAQSQLMREEERLSAQERIEKVPIKMLIPLGTLVVPAMLLAIMGPIIGASISFV